MDLNERYTHIEALLGSESNGTVAEREACREHIQEELAELTAEITKLHNRLHRLPELPPAHLIEWASAVQELDALAFVILETTGVSEDSDIIRVLVADRDGETLLDYVVQPQRQSGCFNTRYTGLEAEHFVDAPMLAYVWPELRQVLRGRYVLAYNLNFVRDRLHDNADHYHLAPLTFIGEDLQDRARSYWNSYYSPKLVDLCERIGHALPQPALAEDRVQGQLALLKAMSQGMTDVRQPAAEEVDENPF